MSPRILIIVILLLLASPLASAGVIVFESDAPIAVQPEFSIAVDESAEPLGIETSDGQDSSMAVSPSTSVLVFAAIASDTAPQPTSLSVTERIEIGNADLPPCPLLGHLLKPS